MEKVAFKESFYKTQELLEENYKVCDNLKKVNKIYRNLVLNLIDSSKSDDFTKHLGNIIIMCDTIEGEQHE